MYRGLETGDDENAVAKRRKIAHDDSHTNRPTSKIFAPFRARILMHATSAAMVNIA